MARNPLYPIDGPFYAESVRQGDPYELSNGHPIVLRYVIYSNVRVSSCLQATAFWIASASFWCKLF